MNIQDENSRGAVLPLLINKYSGAFSVIFTICVLLLALSYGGMLGGGNVFISADLYEQCAPFASLYTRKLLERSNLFYSFNTGLGMNTSFIFAFGVLSPFNILYFFANGNNINGIALAVFVLKAGMAAYSFQLFSRYNLKVNGVISILFSMGYALSSYGVAIVYSPSLYDGIYLLPLILVAIKYLVDNNKILWLILLYTLLFVTNFYSGYIVGVSSFGYLCIYIVGGDISYKKISILKKYFIGVLSAFLLSAFVIVPTVYDILRQDAFDSEYNFAIVPVWNMISCLFPYMDFKMSANIPYIYCGIPAIFLLVGFFTNLKIERKYKVIGGIALIIGILSMVFRPLYSLAHMFNDPTGYTYRYAYIISLIICSMGLMAFKKLDGIQFKKTITIVGGLVLIHCLSPVLNEKMGLYDNSPRLYYYLITIVVVIIWGFLLGVLVKFKKNVASRKEAIKRNIAIISIIVMGFEVCLNSYILITTQFQKTEETYNYVTAQADLLTREICNIDSLEYRVHYDGLLNMNQACVYDYKGSTLYATSNNRALKDFLYSLGICCSDFFILGKGSTDLSHFLLNEKYNLGAYMSFNEWNENYIEENPTVGFGFMVDGGINDISYTDNVFDNQNAIYSALLGERVSPYSEYTGELLLDGENVIISSTDDGHIIFSLADNASLGYIKISLPGPTNDDEMYAWLSSGHNTIHSMSPVINSPSVYEECEYIKPLLMAPHIVKMSEEDGEYDIYIYLATNTVKKASISDYHFASYNDSYIYELWDKMSQQAFFVEEFKDGYVAGNITTIEPGVCFVSIPYEEGWSAIVDGQKQEIMPLFNGSFIGVPLDTGYHEIELQFVAPYSKLGIILSFAGVIMLLAMFIIECKSFIKEKE